MEEKSIHLGFGHTVAYHRVVAILAPAGQPMKRLRDRAEQEARLLDVSCGRRTRAIIITDSNHVILSSTAPETLWRRAGGVKEEPEA
jgi:regulator of extracellular matrix RemA (YlzA/DUF370 family)